MRLNDKIHLKGLSKSPMANKQSLNGSLHYNQPPRGKQMFILKRYLQKSPFSVHPLLKFYDCDLMIQGTKEKGEGRA